MVVNQIYMNINQENVTHCPACDNNAAPLTCLSGTDHLVSKEVFHVSACQVCGHMYTNPRPNELSISKYYESADYISHQDGSRNVREYIYHQVKRLMLIRKKRIVRRFVKPGSSFLDIGCGTGEFLRTLMDAGYITTGVEPLTQARQLASAKGISVYDSLESIEEGNRTFDGISLWHVFEHMYDIQDNMNKFRACLSNDGCLFVAVPIRDSFDAVCYKGHWAAYDLPRHLHHFSRNALVSMAKSNGFMLLGRYSLPFDSYYVSLLSESYMQFLPRWLGYIRALAIGMLSNMLALIGNRPASSELFVFKKR
jgi:2-polyprenyl-3-methyl-5-hydroxy-6-metoxy-1,4-benzoquinol methylase